MPRQLTDSVREYLETGSELALDEILQQPESAAEIVDELWLPCEDSSEVWGPCEPLEEENHD